VDFTTSIPESDFRYTHSPRIVFRVRLGDEVVLHYHDLRERNVDLLLGRVLEPKEDDMNVEVLFEERLYTPPNLSDRPCLRRN